MHSLSYFRIIFLCDNTIDVGNKFGMIFWSNVWFNYISSLLFLVYVTFGINSFGIGEIGLNTDSIVEEKTRYKK